MKKKNTKQGKILNSEKENPIDVTGIGDVGDKSWEAKTLAAESTTKLEDDKGEGNAIKLFFYNYQANPEAFKIHKPQAQELFNHHLKQIEIDLWTKGWTIYPEIQPRLMFAKDKSHYRFIVAATPSRGRLLFEQPKTLTEIINGR